MGWAGWFFSGYKDEGGRNITELNSWREVMGSLVG